MDGFFKQIRDFNDHKKMEMLRDHWLFKGRTNEMGNFNEQYFEVGIGLLKGDKSIF